MRPLFSLALCTAVAWPIAAAAQSFPHEAYVIRDSAEVRSGPGANFAATDRLDRGTEVEVHRRDPGGWLAVRPPEGSFDWVEGRYLKLDADGRLAVSKESGVMVRMGSNLVGFRPDAEWQVKLDHGEQVEVLGRKQTGDQLWYKIAPPAGEFRWLREIDVANTPPQPGDEPPPAAEPTTEPNAAPSVQLVSGGDFQPTATPPAAIAAPAALPVAPPLVTVPIPAAAAIPTTPLPTGPATVTPAPMGFAPGAAATGGDGFVQRRKPGEAGGMSGAPTSPATTTGAAATAAAPVATLSRPVLGSDDAVLQELSDLEVDLAFELSREPAQWNLEPVRIKANACNDAATSPVARTKSREMLHKLAEFEALRQRHVQLMAIQLSAPAKTPPPVAPSTVPVAPSPSALGSAAVELTAPTVTLPGSSGPALNDAAGTPLAASPPAVEFDGEGFLMPVITRRADVPPFALTDENGRLLSFVTPQPGVNLERYKKQKIGIKGSRGFIDEFNKPHLTAERIKVLEDTLRR